MLILHEGGKKSVLQLGRYNAHTFCHHMLVQMGKQLPQYSHNFENGNWNLK
jgi:hypothetical protein